MSKVVGSQLIGNKGEAFVTYKLSELCLVRHASSGTDIGIDLFCESIQIESGKPFLHFWIQVKTRKKKNYKEEYFKVKHLNYWKRQPIPVFVFLISLDDNIESDDCKIKVINLTEYFLRHSVPEKGKKLKIKADYDIPNKRGLQNFINIYLPNTTARLNLKNGALSTIPTMDEKTYIKRLLPELSHKYTERILNSIRNTGFVISDISQTPEISTDIDEDRRHIGEILETFLEKKRWTGKYDIYYHIGLSKEMDQDYPKAVEFYQIALKKIQNDKKVIHDPYFILKQEELENRIRRLTHSDRK